MAACRRHAHPTKTARNSGNNSRAPQGHPGRSSGRRTDLNAIETGAAVGFQQVLNRRSRRPSTARQGPVVGATEKAAHPGARRTFDRFRTSPRAVRDSVLPARRIR
jgi:hypothetical protein